MIEVEFNKNCETIFIFNFTPARFSILYDELALILDSRCKKCFINNKWEVVETWDYIHGNEISEPSIEVIQKALDEYNRTNKLSVKYIDVKTVQEIKNGKNPMVTETGKNLLAIINKNIQDRAQKERDEEIKKANNWLEPHIKTLFEIISKAHTTDYQITLVDIKQAKPNEIDLYKLGLIEKKLGVIFTGKTKIDNLKYESREPDMFAITINLKNLIKLLEGNYTNES